MGHSSGEIAAAYTAGLLSAAQAITIAYYRGYVVGKAKYKGLMVAAGISPTTASILLEDKMLASQLTIACINSPESVTISGESAAAEEICATEQENKIFVKKLQTGGKGYHSHMMQEVDADYEALLNTRLHSYAEAIQVPRQLVKMFSSVGMDGHSLPCFSNQPNPCLDPSYWRSNLELPVQFFGAMTNLIASGKYHLIEIGPHPALQLPVKQIRTSLGLQEVDLPYNSSLVRGKDSGDCLKTLAGHLYLHGHSLNFLTVNGVHQNGSLLHNLTPYPWRYGQLLWSEPRSSAEYRNREYIRHEILGTKTIRGNGIDHTWFNKLKLHEVPWLKDHKVRLQHVFCALYEQHLVYDLLLRP